MQAQSISNIGSGKYAKIFLEWEDPWWAPGEGGIQLAWPEQSSSRNSTANINDLGGGGGGDTGSSGDDDYDDVGGGGNVGKDSHLRHWYRGISNFSEVDGHRNVLLCWVAGESARIADRLDDEEVGTCYSCFE